MKSGKSRIWVDYSSVSVYHKIIAMVLISIMIADIVIPISLYAGDPIQQDALSGGGGDGNMVNTNTGEFNYSIPVITVPDGDGEGFPVTLSYSSSVLPESEASWVGYGWNLDVGSINRNKRGNADDLAGETVETINKTPDNITVTVTPDISGEFADFKPLSGNASISVIYNNISGLGTATSVGLSCYGVGLGLNSKDGDVGANVSFNPSAVLAVLGKSLYGIFEGDGNGNVQPKNEYSHVPALAIDTYSRTFGGMLALSHSFGSNPPKQVVIPEYTSETYALRLGVQGANVFHLGLDIGLSGSYSKVSTNPNIESSAYGYLHEDEVTDDKAENEKILRDYSTEKAKSIDPKKRYFLPPSFALSDQFNVTGIGGGMFSAHHTSKGQYSPTRVSNTSDIVQVGLQAMLGANVGGSGRVNVGKNGSSVLPIKPKNIYRFDLTKNSYLDKNSHIFRYRNDLGGSVEFDTDDEPIQASLGSMQIGRDDFFNEVNRGKTVTQSSLIDYRTYENVSGSKYSKSYRELKNDVLSGNSSGKVQGVLTRSIAQFNIVQPGGKKLTYGYPLYTCNEISMNYGLYDYTNGVLQIPPPTNIDDGNIYVISSDEFDNKIEKNEFISKSGEIRNTPYAHEFLLTEIRSNDYVDRGGDGLTEDDYGSYVKFEYDKTTSTPTDTDVSKKWALSRFPYIGFNYSKGHLSDIRDNSISYQSSQKEVAYLRRIETKTHVAYFINNGSTTSNLGGNLPAGLILPSATPRRDMKPTNGFVQLNSDSPYRYLCQIQLWAKNPVTNLPEKLVQKVQFQYDYTLLKGHPSCQVGSGKLTLKRMWTEYNGVVNANISPYIFGYTTPPSSEYNSNIPSSFGYNNFYSTNSSLNENPDYIRICTDRWGSYRDADDARSHSSNDNPWVTQQGVSNNFDPSAWKLKTITLPTRGQIHIFYEQNKYLYVQDKRAQMMVKLIAYNNSDHTYTIDASQMGVNGNSSGDLDDVVKLIREQYIDKSAPMYYNFTYDFSPVDLNLPLSEAEKGFTDIVRGYSRISDIEKVGSNIKIKFHSDTDPIEHAKDFIIKNRQFKNREDEPGFLNDVSRFSVDIVKNLFSAVTGGILTKWTKYSTIRKNVIPEKSYLRIPILKEKIGGGVRVKRLIVYNPAGSLESSTSSSSIKDGAVYGSEYVYEMFDGKRMVSSGVATNEPGAGRDENAIVDVISDVHLETDEYIGGEDIIQCEGPIGESLLPGSAISYSRVIVKNINTRASSTGYSVYDYHTTKDFPSITLKKGDMSFYNDEASPIASPLLFNANQRIEASQGYSFILNHMNGKLKSVRRYSGKYTVSEPSITVNSEPIQGKALYEQRISYYGVGESVPLLVGTDRPFRYSTPGKEMEVTMDGRHIKTNTEDMPIEASLTWMGPPPWFLPSFMMYTYQKTDEVLQHVTSKVTSYPVFTKNVTTITDGITTTSENIAFSETSGEAVITRSFDSHNGLNVVGGKLLNGAKTTYSIPAHLVYPEMGLKSSNEGLTILAKRPYAAPDRRLGKLDMSLTQLPLGVASQTKEYQLTITLKPSDASIGVADLHIRNDIEGRLALLKSMIVRGDILNLCERAEITIDGKSSNAGKITDETSKTLTVAEVNVNSANYSITYTFSPTIETVTIGQYDALRIEYSGKSNLTSSTVETISIYGDCQLDARLEYGKYLNRRQHEADNKNNIFQEWAYKEFGDRNPPAVPPIPLNYCIDYNLRSGYHSELGGVFYFDDFGGNRLGWERGYLWDARLDPQQNGNDCNSKQFDPIWYYQIMNSQYKVESTYSKFGIEMHLVHPNWVRDVWDNNNAKDKVGKLWCRMYADDNPDSRVMLDNFNNVLKPQQLAFSGTERFWVNDDGELTFSTVNGQGNKRTLALRYRGDFCRHPNSALNMCQGCGPRPINYTPVTNEELFGDVPVNPYPNSSFVLGCRPSRLNAIPENFNNIKVLDAKAVVLSDDWNYTVLGYGVNQEATTPYEQGTKGKWRITKSYAYRNSTAGANVTVTPSVPNYESGYVESGFIPFFRSTTVPNNTWVLVQRIDSYYPNGKPAQEYDILNDMPTCAKYAMNQTSQSSRLPILVVKNAEYNAAFFSSFEEYQNTFNISTITAHTGKKAIRLPAPAVPSTTVISVPTGVKLTGRLTDAQLSGGLQVRYWSRIREGSVWLTIAGLSGTQPTNTVVAQAGEWVLNEVLLSPSVVSSLSTQNALILDFNYSVMSSSANPEPAFVDDVRVQPLFSVANSTVYDPVTMRKLADLDDQHFAMLYQYNMEGTLVRTMKETVNGIVTIKDVHTHIPQIQRDVTAYNGGAYGLVSSTTPPAHGAISAEQWQPSQMVVPSGSKSNKNDNPFDILDVQINKDTRSVKFFGKDSIDIDKLKKQLNPDSLFKNGGAPLYNKNLQLKPNLKDTNLMNPNIINQGVKQRLDELKQAKQNVQSADSSIRYQVKDVKNTTDSLRKRK